MFLFPAKCLDSHQLLEGLLQDRSVHVIVNKLSSVACLLTRINSSVITSSLSTNNVVSIATVSISTHVIYAPDFVIVVVLVL